MALLARLAHLLQDRGRPGHQLELTRRSSVTLTHADHEDKAPGCGWCPIGPGLEALCRLLPASILTLGSDPLCHPWVRQPAGSLQGLFISLLKHLLKLHQCGIRPAISGLGGPPPFSLRERQYEALFLRTAQHGRRMSVCGSFLMVRPRPVLTARTDEH